VTLTADTRGSFQHFVGGSIFWLHVLPEAAVVLGSIRDRYVALGMVNSFLGYPVNDEQSAGRGRGRQSTFQRGALCRTPSGAVLEVHGLIFARWAALGREEGFLGFPFTDELVTPDGIGRYNHFEGGSIYWSPNTGAHDVSGFIREAWANDGLGWERGTLGYPTSDPASMPGSSTAFQDFQGGSIYDNIFGTRIVRASPSRAVFTTPGPVITWADLGTRMSDNDVITMSFRASPPNSPTIVTLNAGPGISWWKAVSVWSPLSGDLFEAATEGQRTTAALSIPVTTLTTPGLAFQFKKAKFWGVHTGMYWLFGLHRLVGTSVTFTWLRD
jgi:uncharacterized protein with LGFP repeats